MVADIFLLFKGTLKIGDTTHLKFSVASLLCFRFEMDELQ